ncbi:IPT/TIG domain-containing protein, partial [Paenibacillus sp. Soil724D2]|uniref:IPT/TIG domain-containing protein n=1 Tax=Paenibacillus sp. (strain Soil724D2) TaxID=1736392 RepID=UPI0007161A29
MRRMKQWLVLMLTFSMIFSGLMLRTTEAAAAVNDYVSVTKTVSPTIITTEDTADVTLNITGTPPVNVVVPNDVVLIIDKSGSMAPAYNNGEDKMTNAKNAAKGFVDLMDLTKHRVAVVDFSSTNMISSIPFTTDKDVAKNYINGIQANGGTATGDAIQAAINLLVDHRPEAQPVIVIMTDGEANQPSNDPYGYAKQKAQDAKDAGIITYTIALLKPSEDPDTSGPNILLKEMATTAAHHHFVLGSTGLAEIYAAIVKEIGLASAFDVTVMDIVDPNFEIVPGSADNNIPKPTINGNTLIWDFNELKDSTLSFTYKIRPVSKTKTGTFPVSTASSVITYKDYAGASRSKSISSVSVKVKLPAPEITSLDKHIGHPNGGETVVINGNHFVSGATVLFGTMPATNVVYVSDTQLTVTAPAGAQGVVNVTVSNPDVQQASAPYQYKADPIVTNIEPNNGPIDGGTLVFVSGNYFMKGVTAQFGDLPASVVYVNPSYIKVTSPMVTTPGPVDITFTNPDETNVVVPGGFTYNAPPKTDPEITTVTPNTGLITGGDLVYIVGKNFKSGMTVFVGGKQASTTFMSTTKLSIIVPVGDAVGTVDVAVSNLNNALFTLPGAYTYTAVQYPSPTISTIIPNSGLIAGGDLVYVSGTNFVNGVTQVMIGGKPAATTYMSKTSLKVIVPAGDGLGSVDVKVITDTKVGKNLL